MEQHNYWIVWCFFFPSSILPFAFASTSNECSRWTNRHNAFTYVAMRRCRWHCRICCSPYCPAPHRHTLFAAVLSQFGVCRHLCILCLLRVRRIRRVHATAENLALNYQEVTVCFCEWKEQRRRRRRLEMWAIEISNNNEKNNYIYVLKHFSAATAGAFRFAKFQMWCCKLLFYCHCLAEFCT